MKSSATIAIVATMLLVAGFTFRSEIQAALTEIVDVKLTQRTVVRLMNGNTQNDCMSAISHHTGQTAFIKQDDEAYAQLPAAITKHSPTFCLISTNHISFAWNIGPSLFWSLEVSSAPINITEINQIFKTNTYAQANNMNVVKHGINWIILEHRD